MWQSIGNLSSVIHGLIHSECLSALTSFASFIFTYITAYKHEIVDFKKEKTGTLEKCFASG